MPKIDQQKELNKIAQEILDCPICRKSGQGLLVPGEGDSNADLMFVGEAPGKTEIVLGRPFSGRSGKLLDGLLESINLSREDIFIGSAVKYLPKTYVTPKPFDIEHGRLHLFKQISVIQPKVIVVMGNIAAQALLHQKFSIAQEHGKFIKRDGLIYFLSYHPAAPLYNPKIREVIAKDFKKLKKYL